MQFRSGAFSFWKSGDQKMRQTIQVWLEDKSGASMRIGIEPRPLVRTVKEINRFVNVRLAMDVSSRNRATELKAAW
jgi:hypothetical protein